MKICSSGFTLVEICIATALCGILGLVITEVFISMARNSQSVEAAEEFNSDVNLLVSLINSTHVMNGSTSGCTLAFAGMSVTGTGDSAVPQISTSNPLPSPSPLSSYVAYISAPSITAPVAIFPVASASPNAQAAIVQVTAPSASTGNQFFPAPRNNLWVTSLYFVQALETGVSPPTGPISITNGWVSNLYQLRLTAQKISNSNTPLIGGLTSFIKDFLVLLWVSPSGLVTYCGPNPP